MTDSCRVVVAMMQRDEDTRLEAWIKYHAHLFGYENLHIFDNGSRSRFVQELLQKYRTHGVNVYYEHSTQYDFPKKGEIISKKFNQLEEDTTIDIFLPLDCDEFLAIRQADGTIVTDRNTILFYLASIKHIQDVLVVYDAFANILGNPGYFFEPYAHHKVFFSRGICSSMSEGFHTAKSRVSQGEYLTDLVYLHFHYRPYEDMVEKSRLKLSHFTNVSDAAAVENYEGPAFHVKQFLSISKSEYESGFSGQAGMHLPRFVDFVNELGIGGAFLSSI